MTIDLDSTIVEVPGDKKQGAAYGYTKVLGYHPLLATRVNRAGLLLLRLPERWPWEQCFTRALDRLRALPLVT